MFPVPIHVFENHNAVALISVEATGAATGPAVVFSNPKAASFIRRDGDRVLNMGL